MLLFEEYLEKLKDRKIILIFQQATKTSRIDDGSILYLEEHSYKGTLKEVFDGGWILVDDALFNLRFIIQIFEKA